MKHPKKWKVEVQGTMFVSARTWFNEATKQKTSKVDYSTFVCPVLFFLVLVEWVDVDQTAFSTPSFWSSIPNGRFLYSGSIVRSFREAIDVSELEMNAMVSTWVNQMRQWWTLELYATRPQIHPIFSNCILPSRPEQYRLPSTRAPTSPTPVKPSRLAAPRRKKPFLLLRSRQRVTVMRERLADAWAFLMKRVVQLRVRAHTHTAPSKGFRLSELLSCSKFLLRLGRALGLTLLLFCVYSSVYMRFAVAHELVLIGFLGRVGLEWSSTPFSGRRMLRMRGR